MKSLYHWHVSHGPKDAWSVRLYAFHPFWHRLDGAAQTVCGWLQHIPGVRRYSCYLHDWLDHKDWKTERTVLIVPMTAEQGRILAEEQSDAWGWTLDVDDDD